MDVEAGQRRDRQGPSHDRAVNVTRGHGEEPVVLGASGEIKNDRDGGHALTDIDEREPRLGSYGPRIAEEPLGQGPSLLRTARVKGVEGRQGRLRRKAPVTKRVRARLEQMLNVRKCCHSVGSPPVQGIGQSVCPRARPRKRRGPHRMLHCLEGSGVAGHTITLVASASLPTGNI